MASLAICRICCITDVRMHCILNTYLQEIYEQLTALEFERTDKSRPLQVCYICYARLRNCSQLRAACLKGEQLIARILDNNEVIPTQTQNISMLQIVHPVAITVRSCVPKAFAGSENDVKMECDNLTVDVLRIKDEAQLKEEYVEGTEYNEEDFIQLTAPGDSLDTDDVNTGDVDVLDNISHTIKAEDYSTPNSCELVNRELHRKLNQQSVEETTESSGLEVDHSIPTIILKDTCNKTVRVVLYRLQTDDTESSSSVPTKLKLAKLEETTGGYYSNKLDTETFKDNEIKAVQTTSQVVTEEAVVNTPIEVGLQSSAVLLNCNICNRCRKDKHDILKYVQVSHLQEGYTCDICGNRKGDLIQHTRIHTGEKPYKCDTCDKRFGNKKNLIHHLRIHTGERPYICHTCDKGFIQRGSLLRHIRIHTGEKRHKCDTCDKSFIHRCHLLKHILIHTGEKPYKCETCDKRFGNKKSLIHHLRIHTGEKPYKCDICDKRFIQRGGLLRHIRTHTGEKPYNCDTCDKSFVQKVHLLTHIRNHTGEKPYKCDTCGECFNQKVYLLMHNRNHTGERPYKCGTCDKPFRSSSDLLKHTRIHTGIRPFKCDTCDKRFGNKSNLLRHTLTHIRKKPKHKY